MKTITILMAVTAFSLNAMSQNNATTSPAYKNAIVTPKSGLLCIAPSAQPEDKDYYKMINNQMRSVKGNIVFIMNGYRWLKNEAVVNENGKITTQNGQIIYLQNEESINGWGVITSNRCAALAVESPVLNDICTIR